MKRVFGVFPLVSGVNEDHKWEWWQCEVEHELPIAHELQVDAKKRKDRNRRRVEECLRYLDGEAAQDHADKKAR